MKNRPFTLLSPALYCAMSLFACTLIQANSLPPVAVIDLTPDKAVYYAGETIALYGGNSYVQSSGSINYYIWYINGVKKLEGSGATSYNHTVVIETGLTEQLLTIRLRVRHSNGKWGEQTVTRTEKQKPGQHYYLSDHLGSVRATVNAAGTLIGWDDYYPFGMVMPGRSSNTANPNDLYKYTGHERDTEAGLEIDFMNARTYDSEIGRFLQRDPLLNEANHKYLIDFGYYSTNPYNYVFNNPINFTDPDGRCATCIGFVLGGAIGAGAAYIQGKDVTTGLLSGAAAGAIAGAFIDAVPTGGGSLLLVGAAVAGGATGGAVGSLIDQAGNNLADGQDLKTAVGNIDANQVLVSTAAGGAAGLLGGVAGTLTANAAATTPATIEAGRRALNSVSSELYRQGAGTGTVHGAQNAIVNGIHNAAVNTANSVAGVNAVTTATTTVVTQGAEAEIQRRRQDERQ